MNFYFNRRPVEGPWGGGSKVLSSIVKECLKRSHQIFFEEEIHSSNKFDLLFCMDPRTSSVSYDDLIRLRDKTGSKIIQRVGDLGTHGKPDLTRLVVETCKLSDYVIVPSVWSKRFLLNLTKDVDFIHVIENAPLIDFESKNSLKDFTGTIRIVTHHWSNNAMKGFETYSLIDEYCANSNGKFEFTFIGRKPEDFKFRNYIEPQDVKGLLRLLPQNHIYLTSSKKEAGANHVLEAMSTGLPVLYHSDGGSIVDYCKNRGISYEIFEDIVYHLENNIKQIEEISKSPKYSRNNEEMAREYVDFFESVSQ